MGQSYFDFLGLPWDASYTDVEAAYKRLRQKWAGDATRLQELELAFKTLMSPGLRRAHKKSVERERSGDAEISSLPAQGSPADPMTIPHDSRSDPDMTGRAPTQSHTSGVPTARSKTETQFFTPPQLPTDSPPATDKRRAKPATSQEPSVKSPGRQPTVIYDSHSVPPAEPKRDEGRSAPPPAPRSSGGRQPTMLFDPSQHGVTEPERSRGEADSPPQAHSPAAAGDGAARSKTPVEPAGERSSGRQASSRGRQPTEIFSNYPASADDARGDETVIAPGARNEAPPSAQHHISSDLEVEIAYKGGTEHVLLRSGDNLIGRPPLNGPKPDIPLADPNKFVSRQHAVLRVEEDRCYIIDQGSDNGTRVNGRKIDKGKPYPLNIEHDVIDIEGRLLVVRPARRAR